MRRDRHGAARRVLRLDARLITGDTSRPQGTLYNEVMTRSPRLSPLWISLALALACGTAALGASPEPSPAAGGLATPDYRIETDETHWNFNSGDFTMPHRVRFYRPGTDATGDKATGNSKRGTATLIGSVVVHDSGNASEAGDAAYRGSGPATLTCDQLDIDSKAKMYTATGHVHFAQGTRTGIADKATLNRANGTLHLEGGVHLSDNGSTLTADAVDYNLNTKDAEVHGGPAVMTQPANQPQQRPVPARTQAPKAGSKAAAKPKPKPTPAATRKP